jgi:hypothetical protein
LSQQRRVRRDRDGKQLSSISVLTVVHRMIPDVRALGMESVGTVRLVIR